MQYTEYIAKQGDRWDLISQANYQTPWLYDEIAQANPTYIGLITFEGGERLEVPIRENTGGTVAVNSIPPWRR